MIHNLDFVSELLGVPLEVKASGIEQKNSHVYATLIYKDATAMIEATSLLPSKAPFQIGFNIIFEKGSLRFSGEYGHEVSEKMHLFTSDKANSVDIPGRNEYEVLIQKVINSIRNDTSIPGLSLEAAGNAITIADAIMGAI